MVRWVWHCYNELNIYLRDKLEHNMKINILGGGKSTLTEISSLQLCKRYVGYTYKHSDIWICFQYKRNALNTREMMIFSY